MATDLSIKRLQLLKEAIPRLTRLSVLWNPAQPWHPKVLEELKAIAPEERINQRIVKFGKMGFWEELPDDVAINENGLGNVPRETASM